MGGTGTYYGSYPGAVAMDKALVDEEKKLRMLRLVIDLNQAVLMQQRDLTLREAFEIMKNTKLAALNLFPDKEEAYELIYAPRFRRIIRERFVILGGLAESR